MTPRLIPLLLSILQLLVLSDAVQLPSLRYREDLSEVAQGETAFIDALFFDVSRPYGYFEDLNPRFVDYATFARCRWTTLGVPRERLKTGTGLMIPTTSAVDPSSVRTAPTYTFCINVDPWATPRTLVFDSGEQDAQPLLPYYLQVRDASVCQSIYM